MSEREQQILKTFADVIPKLSENEKNRLLGYGEGMAAVCQRRDREEKRELQMQH